MLRQAGVFAAPRASRHTSRTTATVFCQISSASCSTQPGLRIDLLVLARLQVVDAALAVEQHRLGAGGALIDGQDEAHDGLAVGCRSDERRLGEPFHRDPVVPEDVGLRAGDGVFVGDADDAERHGHARLHQDRRAGLAQAAVDHVLLGGDDRAAVAAGGEDALRVERLDRVHADHAALQAVLLLQERRREQAVDHRLARGDERDVVAVAQGDRAADLEPRARIVQAIQRRLAEAEVDRAVAPGGGEDGLARLEVVGGDHDVDVVDRPQRRQVVQRVVRLPSAP